MYSSGDASTAAPEGVGAEALSNSDGQDRLALLRGLGLSEKATGDGREQANGSAGFLGRYWWLAIALATAVLVVLGAGAILLARPSPAETSSVRQPEDVAGRPLVEAAAGSSAYAAVGYVVARRQATVAAEVTARVVRLPVEEGQFVRRGDVLAELDDEIARSDARAAGEDAQAAHATIAALEAELDDVRATYERLEKLRSRGFSTIAAVTSARSRLSSLEAQAERSRSEYRSSQEKNERAREQARKFVIRAPFDGVVVSRSAQVGEVISPVSAGGSFTRTGICTLVDMGSLELLVDVAEAYLSRVKVGQTGQAVLDAYPEEKFPAKIVAVIPSINKEKGTVSIRIRMESQDSRFMPNMGVKVYFS